ncbi:MAG: MarC family protein [Pelobium sp.]
MTSELLTFSVSVFAGFFAVMNPVAITPVFLGLVNGESEATKKRIAKKACLNAFCIVLFFLILGKYIFELFEITIPAFKITGGILMFFIGFQMLMSNKPKIHGHPEVNEDDNVAISPLAIPILAGPGTIVTAMNDVTDASPLYIGVVILILALMIFLNYLALSLSDIVVRTVGVNLIAVVGKLMGLILAIIGCGMIITGIKLVFFEHQISALLF